MVSGARDLMSEHSEDQMKRESCYLWFHNPERHLKLLWLNSGFWLAQQRAIKKFNQRKQQGETNPDNNQPPRSSHVHKWPNFLETAYEVTRREKMSDNISTGWFERKTKQNKKHNPINSRGVLIYLSDQNLCFISLSSTVFSAKFSFFSPSLEPVSVCLAFRSWLVTTVYTKKCYFLCHDFRRN